MIPSINQRGASRPTVDALKVWLLRAGHCEFRRGLPAMVSESIAKPEAAPLEELLSFSTAPSDGVLDELMQNVPIAGLGEKTNGPCIHGTPLNQWI
jgi:hypothetical protein